jgi:hypothetical protein
MIPPPSCSVDIELPDGVYYEDLCDEVVCYEKDESGNVSGYTVEDLKREDEKIDRQIRDSRGTDRQLRSLNKQRQFIYRAFIKPNEPDYNDCFEVEGVILSSKDWRPRTRKDKQIAKKFLRRRKRQFEMTERGEKSAGVRGYEDRSFATAGAAA